MAHLEKQQKTRWAETKPHRWSEETGPIERRSAAVKRLTDRDRECT